MKNKEKEIEEMSRDLCHSRTCDIKKNGGNCYKYCNAYIYAFRAVNAGYRKASDVAREIFEEIEKILDLDKITDGLHFEAYLGADVAFGRVENKIAELKKKYESEEKK